MESTFYNYDIYNKDEPIHKDEEEYQTSYFLFNFFIGHLIDNFWQVTKVTEEKGVIENLFGLEEKSSIGGNFYKTDIYCVTNTPMQYGSLEGRVLLIFSGYNEFTDYIEYKRQRISIFDILANIFSLAMALFNGFTFGFTFLYSNNFDNYKIIDKILSKNNITFKSIKNIDEISNDDSPPLLTELKNVEDFNEENSVDKKIIEDKKIKEGAIPKFHVFDFIYNTFFHFVIFYFEFKKISINFFHFNAQIRQYFNNFIFFRSVNSIKNIPKFFRFINQSSFKRIKIFIGIIYYNFSFTKSVSS